MTVPGASSLGGLAFPEVSPDLVKALFWSRRAATEARRRMAAAAQDGFAFWSAAVEATWWVAALDESFGDKGGFTYTPGYAEVRDRDSAGRTVRAMRWLRNRHAHEITVTGRGGPKPDFYGGPADSYVFFISPANRWKRSSEIKHGRLGNKERGFYDEVLGGQPIEQTLGTALKWFDRVFEASGYTEPAWPEDPSVLE